MPFLQASLPGTPWLVNLRGFPSFFFSRSIEGSKGLRQTHRARLVVLGCQDPVRRSMSEWSVGVVKRWFLEDQDWLQENAPLERHREMHRVR